MRRLVLTALTVFLSAAAASAFDPTELNKITFQNSTGKNIQTIFLSPSDSEEWGPDIVGADYHLADGDSIGYFVHYPGTSFTFDILATDESGGTFELYEYVLTDGKEAMIALTKKSLKSSPPDFTYVKLNVTNDTVFDMEYLFISPSDSEAWGVDLLDENSILSAGETYSFVIPMFGGKVKYNVMAADEDMDEYGFNITLDPARGDEFDVSIEPDDME